MELATIVTDKGTIGISRITIETLIRLVLLDVAEIIHPQKRVLTGTVNTSFDDGTKSGKNINQEVKIEIKANSIVANLFLTIHYGVRIPDLTWEVQAKAREIVKKLTGLDIEHINVHIQAIYFSKKYHNKGNLVAPGSFLKIF